MLDTEDKFFIFLLSDLATNFQINFQLLFFGKGTIFSYLILSLLILMQSPLYLESLQKQRSFKALAMWFNNVFLRYEM